MLSNLRTLAPFHGTFILALLFTVPSSAAPTCADAFQASASTQSALHIDRLFPGISAPTVRLYTLKGSDTATAEALTFIQTLQQESIQYNKQGNVVTIELADAKVQKLRERKINGLDVSESGPAVGMWNYKSGAIQIHDGLIKNRVFRTSEKATYTVVALEMNSAAKTRIQNEMQIELADALSQAFPTKMPTTMSVQERIALYQGKPQDILNRLERRSFTPTYFAIADKHTQRLSAEIHRELTALGVAPTVHVKTVESFLSVINGISLAELKNLISAIESNKSIIQKLVIDKITE